MPYKPYTVQEAARLTGKSEQMIRRWIRPPKDGRPAVIKSVPDPKDKHRRLIPFESMLDIASMPQLDRNTQKIVHRLKTVTLTFSDGRTQDITPELSRPKA